MKPRPQIRIWPGWLTLAAVALFGAYSWPLGVGLLAFVLVWRAAIGAAYRAHHSGGITNKSGLGPNEVAVIIKPAREPPHFTP